MARPDHGHCLHPCYSRYYWLIGRLSLWLILADMFLKSSVGTAYLISRVAKGHQMAHPNIHCWALRCFKPGIPKSPCVLPTSLRFASSSPSESLVKDDQFDFKRKMPVTIISGFLGAGKTTFLQNLLQNDQGTKFGLVVNDMASVNVDSKLIKRQTQLNVPSTSTHLGGATVDTLELQNGCVCCNLADDLILSVSKLCSLAYIRGSAYDHIVVECSGYCADVRMLLYSLFCCMLQESLNLAQSVKYFRTWKTAL
jgi:hypothetical protein